MFVNDKILYKTLQNVKISIGHILENVGNEI